MKSGGTLYKDGKGGKRMKAEKKQLCSSCGKEQAKTECDHCGKALCRDCSKLEIWGNGAEDLSVRYFCVTCKNDPAVNPWGAHSNISESLVEEEAAPRIRASKKIRRAAPKKKEKAIGPGHYSHVSLYGNRHAGI
jgi:hypothetical protein